MDSGEATRATVIALATGIGGGWDPNGVDRSVTSASATFLEMLYASKDDTIIEPLWDASECT